jgi:hypothetical protein
MVPGWPQVPLVSKPSAFACRAERLAWARAGPNRSVIWPSGLSQGIGPDANSGEKVALSKSIKLVWRHIADVPFINFT